MAHEKAAHPPSKEPVGLEEKAVEILDHTTEAVSKVAERIGQLAEQYGGDVLELTLLAARVDAASELLPGIVALVFLPVLIWVSRIGFKHADWTDGNFSVALALVGGCLAVIAFIVMLAHVFDVWAWAGVIEPKLWLAKKALHL